MTDPSTVLVASRAPNGLMSRAVDSTPIAATGVEGTEVLLRTACVIAGEACHRVLGKTLVVRHAAGVEQSARSAGYYCGVATDAEASAFATLSEADLSALRHAIAATVANATPIDTQRVPHDTLRRAMTRQGCGVSARLLESANEECYEAFVLRGWYALAHGALTTPDTSIGGLGDQLELRALDGDNNSDGTTLLLRFKFQPEPLPLPASYMRLFERSTANMAATTLQASKEPGKWVEAEERRFKMLIADAAQEVRERGDAVKLILVTGPSASGKTTFSHLLAVALRAVGRAPTVLSVDDYYRDASEPGYPTTPDGKPNHEVVECLRLEDFANDMRRLFAGETVETPIFDMSVSKPKPHGRRTRLRKGGVLIMEGIFALNPKLTASLDAASLFKVFVLPVPQVRLSEHALVSNQALRELRRVVRDFRERGRNASASLRRRATVRKGEEDSIFPSAANADLVFNSTMGHELAVLQPHCATLLRAVRPDDAAYGDAQRQLELLATIAAVPTATVPPESLLREFIGGSAIDDDELRLDPKNPLPVAGLSPTHARRAADAAPPFGEFGLTNVAPGAGVATVGDAVKHVLAAHGASTAPISAESVVPLTGVPPATDASAAVIGALVNGELTGLGAGWPSCRGHTRVDPIFVGSRLGLQVERATLVTLVCAAVQAVDASLAPALQHGFGLEGSVEAAAYFLELRRRKDPLNESANDRDDEEYSVVDPTPELLSAIDAKVRELVAAKTPIVDAEVGHTEAAATLQRQGCDMAARLLHTVHQPTVRVARCAGYTALALQPLAPHAGFCKAFRLEKPEGLQGIAVCYRRGPGENDVASPKLHPRVLEEIEARRVAFSASHGLRCLADINMALAHGEADVHRRLAAAIDSTQLSRVVARVRREGIRVVFVAGSSSSGKSVFADELQRHLRAVGIANSRLCTDAYYRNLDDPAYPLTPRGRNKDCEYVDALRLDDLGAAINRVAAGTTIRQPVFDLGVGARREDLEGPEVDGLPGNGVLVVEGLFALAPQIRSLVDAAFPALGVMIAPLTVVSVDEQRFVSGQVLKILRRIVRDADERGRDAGTTLARWDMVAAGEAAHAVPHMFEADVVVSSTSVLELHQLTARATTLLLQVSPAQPKEFFEARQLLGMLRWAHAYSVAP